MRKTMVVIGLVSAHGSHGDDGLCVGPRLRARDGMGYGPDRPAGMAPARREHAQPRADGEDPEDPGRPVRRDATVRNELFTKRTELWDLFREPVLDQAKIAARQKEIMALQAQVQEKGLAARMAVAEVLTPEQRAQMPAFGPGMGPGFGPGQGFGPGMGMGRMGMGPRMGFGPVGSHTTRWRGAFLQRRPAMTEKEQKGVAAMEWLSTETRWIGEWIEAILWAATWLAILAGLAYEGVGEV